METPTLPQSQPEGVKTCPMCAEEVKAAALVCRFCGYQFKDQLPTPPRPAGPPPEALTAVLRPTEALFVWSPGYLNGQDGSVAITSDRVLFLWGSCTDFQHPINRNRKATVGAGSPTMPAGCRPDGTVVIEFGDDGQRFDFHGLNPDVAKEIGATVVSGLIDKLFPNDPEMQQTLRARHEQISARVAVVATTAPTTIKGCRYRGGLSEIGPSVRGCTLVFGPQSIEVTAWGVTYLTITQPSAAGVALGAGRRKGSSVIGLTVATGETGVFEVKTSSVAELQALLAPWVAGH